MSREKSRTTNINISHSHGIQIGDHNVQTIIDTFNTLIQKIDAADASPEEKAEAKGRLAKFLEHPLVCSVIGGAVGGITGLATGS